MLNASEFLSAKRFARGLCLAIAAFGLCCAAGAAESVQITGGTRANGLITSLTVAFSAREKAATLWLASGKADAGETLGNWEKLDFLADVPAGETSCTCSVVPYADLPVVRVLLIENDAELTELESVSATGTPYVDTGYTPCGTTAVKCEFKIDTRTASALFGARKSSTTGDPMFCLLELNSTQGFRCDYDTQHNSNVQATPGTPYIAEMDYTGLKINGSYLAGCKLSVTPWTATMPCTMMVFAMNNNGTMSSPAKATFSSFKAWDTTGDPSSLALDLVPCQKNGVASFYDRKSGKFLTPNGTLTAGTPKAHSSLGVLAAASASFGAGSAPWAENAVSVTGSARDAKGLLSSLSVAFPATAKASSLWLAWGKEDSGDLLGNWEELDFLAEVQAGATSCTCPMSVTPRHSGLTVARVFLLENDAELTELESVSSAGDSNQFVDTGYVPNGKTGVRCDFSFDTLKGSALFGVRTSTSANQFCLLELPNSGTGFRIDYAGKQSNTLSLQNGAPVAGRRYMAEMDYTGLLINGKHINDYCKLTDGVKTVSPGKSIYLFAMNNNGAASSSAAATIYSFKAWNETGVKSTLKCDLVPCQKNGVVSFYDRKNGNFLPPSGTLTAGSAKAHSSLGGLAGYSGTLRPYGDGRCMTVKDVFRATRRVKAVLETDAALSDSTLLAAFGPEDKGENLADWFKSDGTVAEGATVRVVAAVPGEATSFTATVPDVIDENMKVFRFFLVSRFGGEAYDRVLDGVRATGTQYVQTDIVPTGTFSVQAQFKFDAIADVQCLFGARTRSEVEAFELLHTFELGLRYDYNTKIANTGTKPEYGKFLCVMNASGLGYTNDVNSTTTTLVYRRPTDVSTTFTAGGKLAIFAMNSAGAVSAWAKAVCYRFWAWKVYGDDSTRCLDLVPCVKNGEVGFYNKIGGGFLGNAGMGAFEAVEAADGEQANAAARVFASSGAFPTPPPPGLAIIFR